MAVLLQEIIDLATDSQQPLSVLLRKCLLLAHQLKNEHLKLWSNQELNGYSSIEVPEYRMIGAAAFGIFSGWGGSGARNVGLPSFRLEEAHRRWATHVILTQSVSTLEGLLTGRDEFLKFGWPADLVVLYQSKFLEHQYLVQAWQSISKASVAGALDAIRNRTLNMALELQSELGEEADLKHVTPAQSKTVEKTVSTVIYGGTNYIASDQSQINATTNTVQTGITVGNRDELDDVLRASGLHDSDLNELSEALQQDKKTIGPGITDWIKRAAPKVMVNGAKFGAEVAKPILNAWIRQHLGLPPTA